MPLVGQESRLPQISKRTIQCLVCLGFAGFLYFSYVYQRQLYSLPRTPDPAIGRIYSRSGREFAVYLTRSERDSSDAILFGSIAAIAISQIIRQVYKKKTGTDLGR